MLFKRPTLAELIGRIAADIESRLPGADARLRRNVLNVLARAQAGAAHELHGHIAWLSNQVIYDTAEDEILERWASIWGITRKPAAAAKGSVVCSGTTGSVILTGTLFQRSDGAEFTTDLEATLVAGSATLAVTAVVPGTVGNSEPASSLTLVNPIAGVNSTATVAAEGIAGGTDVEDYDSLRARLLARIQQPPHGGTASDYVMWALEVPGVTRAWVYPHYTGIGTVGVFIVNDDADPIIPDTVTIQAAQAHIDARRPVTAQVTVYAPIAAPLPLTIAVVPNSAAVRLAVTEAVRDYLAREAIPGGTINLSRLREAISAADGELSHTLTAPTADVTHPVGHLATIGVITWA
jgi:uncharacterized phage protein gp47/JayE